MNRLSKMILGVMICLLGIGQEAFAELPSEFPTKPVKLIVPYGPGGAVDITARILAKDLSSMWGQQVVVENKPGAAGMIAANTVAKSSPDAYTLLITDDGVLISMPQIQKNMPYDPLGDLLSIGMVCMFPYVMVTNSKTNIKTMNDLISVAKGSQKGLDYATNGVGSTHHLTWESFQKTAGIKLNHIPYKGAAAALQDVVAGEVSLMIVAVSTALPFIKDGRLVPIAIGSLERLASIANVPTISESGYPGFEAIAWQGVLAPKGTSPALIEKISNDMRKITQSASYKEALILRGTESRTSSALEMSRRIKVEFDKTSSLIKSLNIQLE
ncbi:MAG: tripartite tricarboxylate transporter substrate binding protein [Betaproteobacteria bacterium]